MSNSLAIAAVTTTLQQILTAGVTADPDLNDTTVTILPLDKARGNNTNNQLNLFLYQVLRSAAWSNSDMPRQVKPGETSMPPLPLNLWYLLTAFGRDNDATQPFGHQLLGKAMSVLHDHTVLSSEDIQNATAATLPRADLDRQLERVRITLQPLSIDEISKLWTGFATQYRLSAAYEISVALIESTRAVTTPLPTLTRGKSDQGISSQPDLRSPFPNLTGILIPNQNPSAHLGDKISILGDRLDGSNVGVIFDNPLWTAPVEIPVPAGPDATATQVNVTIPNQPAVWPAGFYSVSIAVQRPGDSFRRTTNQLALAIAPVMTIVPASAPAASNITYTATVTPEVRAEQRASLLLGSSEILADAHPAQTGTLTFQSGPITAGDYFVRLRVDGVDSLLVDRTVTPPVFDPTQKVTVT
ncbi:MAG: DUF4255 domain-containing protein [Terriglobia bacterium]|nr:MAG: DUF4255 domain-containing protein [Terriglobia bacterium]